MSNYSSLLMNDLTAAKRNLNRLIKAGLLLTLVCHFYVIEPYFLYRAEEKSASERLEAGQARIRELSHQLAGLKEAVKGVHTGLEDTKERIRAFPDDLRAMLPLLQRQLSSPRLSGRFEQNYQQSVSPDRQFQRNAPFERRGTLLNMPEEIKTFEEAVRWYTNQWFDGLIKELNEKVISPVLEIRTGSSNDTAEKLSNLSKEAVRKVRHYIGTVDPDFWRSYGGGKVPVARGLYEVVSEAFDPIYREIETLSVAIRNDIEERKATIEKIGKTLTKSRDLLKELESRLETLESPIGRIPVGLTDFIKLYPLLLAAVTAATAFYLLRSRNLYTALFEEYSKGGSGLDEKTLKYQASCWYLPPFKNILNPLLLLTVVILFAGLFIRSVFLITGEPGLFASITSRPDPLSKRIFITGYAFGALAITGSLWTIMRVLTGKRHCRL